MKLVFFSIVIQKRYKVNHVDVMSDVNDGDDDDGDGVLVDLSYPDSQPYFPFDPFALSINNQNNHLKKISKISKTN